MKSGLDKEAQLVQLSHTCQVNDKIGLYFET